MFYGRVSSQYKRSSIETAGKLDQIIMLYDRAIQLLEQAKDHIREKEVDKKISKFQKALDIINALQNCLDMEQGGQIARNLDSLYSYITKRLLVGDIRKDFTAYDESIKILNELREAWIAIKTGEDSRQDAPINNRDMLRQETSHIAAIF